MLLKMEAENKKKRKINENARRGLSDRLRLPSRRCKKRMYLGNIKNWGIEESEKAKNPGEEPPACRGRGSMAWTLIRVWRPSRVEEVFGPHFALWDGTCPLSHAGCYDNKSTTRFGEGGGVQLRSGVCLTRQARLGTDLT